MIALIQEKLPRYVDAKPFEIQVLTPMRKGLLGVERLNQILQRYLNPPEDGKSERAVGDRLFRTGDKVMQIRNNYQMEWEIRGRYGVVIEKGVGVFNGDTGILREINEFAETAEVEFEDGRFAMYSFKQLEELELAYAITIHKSTSIAFRTTDAFKQEPSLYRSYQSKKMCDGCGKRGDLCRDDTQ